MNEPDVMRELWNIKARLSREARQDLAAYCNRLTIEARKNGFMLISSVPDRIENTHSRAVAESKETYG